MTSLPIARQHHYAVYTGRTTSWPMVAATSAGALLLVLMGRQSGTAWTDLVFVVPLMLVGVGALAEVLTGSSVRATAGPNGLTVHWGLLGWPRCTYQLEEIERAEVIELPWWRVSFRLWWTRRRTNCTVRSGPTLRVRLRNGRTVTITVPDPAAAVAALRDAQPPA
jgi:hypothetical protein